MGPERDLQKIADEVMGRPAREGGDKVRYLEESKCVQHIWEECPIDSENIPRYRTLNTIMGLNMVGDKIRGITINDVGSSAEEQYSRGCEALVAARRQGILSYEVAKKIYELGVEPLKVSKKERLARALAKGLLTFPPERTPKPGRFA